MYVYVTHVLPMASSTRSARYAGVDWYGWNRAGVMPVTSQSGSPVAIMDASVRPTPPADRMPMEFSPAAMK